MTLKLFSHYACCFGVELTMYNGAALYYKEKFGQTTESAAALASIFGWMNICSRGLGGFFSDQWNKRYGMRGRIGWHAFCLMTEGILVFIFAHSHSLGGAVGVMAVFSFFVQMATGTTYAIVPYVDPPSTGSISGIVGAGGNVGAVCFGLGFRQMNYLDAFTLMGCVILFAAVSCAGIVIKGHSSLFCGHDTLYTTEKGAVDGVLVVPEKDDEKLMEISEEIDC